MDNKTTHYFVVAKPLQFFVVRSIMKQISGDSVILLVGKFQKSGDFFDFIKSSFFDFREVLYFNSIREAIFYSIKNKVHRLYLPSDVGFIRGVELFLLKLTTPKVCISIYEEGWGFYRKDLYKGIKKILLDKMGFGVHFGGNVFTKNVLVYNVKRYQDFFFGIKNIRLIEMNLAKTILSEVSLYDSWYSHEYLNFFTSTRKLDIVFFTEYETSDDLIKQIQLFEKITKNNNCVYYKLHPRNYANKLDEYIDKKYLKYPEHVPVEYFLLKLLSMGIEINAYHYHSSIAFYLDEYDINFYDMTEVE